MPTSSTPGPPRPDRPRGPRVRPGGPGGLAPPPLVRGLHPGQPRARPPLPLPHRRLPLLAVRPADLVAVGPPVLLRLPAQQEGRRPARAGAASPLAPAHPRGGGLLPAAELDRLTPAPASPALRPWDA